MKNVQQFARKCDGSGVGMNDGFLFYNYSFYASTKEIALKFALELGYKSLDEAYDSHEYSFNLWEDENDFDYVLIDDVLLEIDKISLEFLNQYLSQCNNVNNFQYLISLAFKRGYTIETTFNPYKWELIEKTKQNLDNKKVNESKEETECREIKRIEADN